MGRSEDVGQTTSFTLTHCFNSAVGSLLVQVHSGKMRDGNVLRIRTMAYPAAPWTLYGHALLTVNLLDRDRVRSLVPPEFDIISVFPGKTLGGVYLSQYTADSLLQYSELIVAAALVSHAGKMGAWVSHIYVDNPDSVAGGREIWGLPKQLADFHWQFGKQSEVTVRQGEQTLCRLTYGSPFSLWKQFFAGNSFSTLANNVLFFQAEAELRPGLVSAHLEVPPSSPVADLKFEQPWLTVQAQELRLQVHAPTIVGQCQSQRSVDRQPV